MVKYGIKIISTNPNSVGGEGKGCIKTKRGYEKWVATTDYLSDWPSLPAKLFENLNEAFKYKEKNRTDVKDEWYYVVEEI